MVMEAKGEDRTTTVTANGKSGKDCFALRGFIRIDKLSANCNSANTCDPVPTPSATGRCPRDAPDERVTRAGRDANRDLLSS